ncbi:hypothetical protein B0H19DRAFT_1273915 [Mycena capillaripes]|nr:hypothetical protein B0H19DRAFT_1273915 [Mycena capillaripes]
MNSYPLALMGVPVVNSAGPLMLGHLLHWGLFGTLSVQLYLYYQAFPNDKNSTKTLVYTVYTIVLVDTILITRDAFTTFAYGFGDPAALKEVNLYGLSIPIMSALVSFIGQSFYAYRVHVLSRSLFIPGLIMVVSLASSIGGFMFGAFAFQVSSLALLNTPKVSAAVGVWCGASALSDILIALCMTYNLVKYDTGFHQTHVLMSKLIRLIVETGTLTVALTGLTLFFAFPGHNYCITATALLPELYANSILVVLNSRIQIVGGRATSQSTIDVSSNPSFLHTADMSIATGVSRSSHVLTITRDVPSEIKSNEEMDMKGIEMFDLPISNSLKPAPGA